MTLTARDHIGTKRVAEVDDGEGSIGSRLRIEWKGEYEGECVHRAWDNLPIRWKVNGSEDNYSEVCILVSIQ